MLKLLSNCVALITFIASSAIVGAQTLRHADGAANYLTRRPGTAPGQGSST